MTRKLWENKRKLEKKKPYKMQAARVVPVRVRIQHVSSTSNHPFQNYRLEWGEGSLFAALNQIEMEW